ncbi:MAG: hypothetical protein U0U46_12345 [Saprospiraceae bacterium]
MGRILPRLSDQLDNFQLGILSQIDSCGASKGITSLFVYSGDNQSRQTREKAGQEPLRGHSYSRHVPRCRRGKKTSNPLLLSLMQCPVSEKPLPSGMVKILLKETNTSAIFLQCAKLELVCDYPQQPLGKTI